MLVQHELILLEETRKELMHEMSRLCFSLDGLYRQKQFLNKKTEALKVRTSSLAQTLLKKVQEELKGVSQEIAETEKMKAEIEKEIAENLKNFLKKEDDINLFIEEEVSRMISDFLEYVRNHFDYFGTRIKTTFYIRERTPNIVCKTTRNKEPDSTGVFEIVETGHSIVCSNNPIPKILFWDICGITQVGFQEYVSCKESEWYKKYREKFIQTLLETLQKNYSFDEVFKLTIQNPNFTLELV